MERIDHVPWKERRQSAAPTAALSSPMQIAFNIIGDSRDRRRRCWMAARLGNSSLYANSAANVSNAAQWFMRGGFNAPREEWMGIFAPNNNKSNLKFVQNAKGPIGGAKRPASSNRTESRNWPECSPIFRL
jgi:hypothetical protein